MELKVDGLTKKYDDKTAVDGISFSLHRGVTGLLGANGAGKTTLIKMMCGILMPSSGEITYDGYSVRSEEYRNVLGFLPQDFGYYPEFTGREFLMYIAALKGLGRKAAKARCDEVLELVSLADMANVKMKKYSGGMKQRMGIAQTLINRPEILVLDEPTVGLDPKERVRFRNLIQELGRESIVLLSTHIVSDIEHIADRILMMQSGRIIRDGAWTEADGSLEEYYLKEYE
ncbi:MAG: ABC transporter ATP-binding protein [Lachnospiraceae bacterium]|nr:ABC transporter ATP-binding protein [Lachnospiraceae bacterium]